MRNAHVQRRNLTREALPKLWTQVERVHLVEWAERRTSEGATGFDILSTNCESWGAFALKEAATFVRRGHWNFPSKVASCWWFSLKLRLLEVPKRETEGHPGLNLETPHAAQLPRCCSSPARASVALPLGQLAKNQAMKAGRGVKKPGIGLVLKLQVLFYS